jgi:hypothetical protein
VGVEEALPLNLLLFFQPHSSLIVFVFQLVLGGSALPPLVVLALPLMYL